MYIEYQSDNKQVEVKKNKTILETSLQAGIPHAHACGGHARCSTCRVLVLNGLAHCEPRNASEQRLADRLHFSPEIRLACQTCISGDIKVRRLVLDAEDIELTSQIRAGAISGSVGKEKKVVILFSDIRGFTTFSEKNLPYDVVHILNRYFHEMGAVISNNGGYIDNYIGDGIMALFGVDDAPDAPFRAVKAGLEMLEALETLNPYVESVYKTQLNIGIGIHYGEAVVGTIGAADKKKETAIGDAVNLASRIESANKTVGTRLLISEETYHHVQDRVCIGKNASLELKGKSGRHILSEVVSLKDGAQLKSQSSTTRSYNGNGKKERPRQRQFSDELAIAFGSLLFGAFLVGFTSTLSTGNLLWIFAFVLMGFIGAPMLFWGFIRG